VQNHFIGTKSFFRQIFCLQLVIGGFVADGDNTIMLQQSNQMVAKIHPSFLASFQLQAASRAVTIVMISVVRIKIFRKMFGYTKFNS
jgi:hypothetical protein